MSVITDSPDLITRQWQGVIREVDRLAQQYSNIVISNSDEYKTFVAVRSRLQKLEELYDSFYFQLDFDVIDQQLHINFTDNLNGFRGKLFSALEDFEQLQNNHYHDSPELHHGENRDTHPRSANHGAGNSPTPSEAISIPSQLNSQDGGFQGVSNTGNNDVSLHAGRQVTFQPVIPGPTIMQRSACMQPTQQAASMQFSGQPGNFQQSSIRPTFTQPIPIQQQISQQNFVPPSGNQHSSHQHGMNNFLPQQMPYGQASAQMPVFQPTSHYTYPPAFQYQGFKLPDIALPKFSGNFDDWLEFRSSFCSIVADNITVSQDVKFHYLKSSLSGEAASRILHVPAGNFNMAWSLLTERYDNPKMIADKHVAAILSPPSLNSSSPTSWRNYIDHLKQHTFALEAVNLKIEIKNLLYMYIFVAGFDARTLRDWERHIAQKAVPSMEDLWDFMEAQHKIALAVSPGSTESSIHKAVTPVNTKGNHFKSTQSANRSLPQQAHNNQHFNQYKPYICPFCKQAGHNIFNCTPLSNLNPAAKWEAVKSKKLCFNCLKPREQGHTCSGSCKLCYKPHHTLLHQGANQGNNNSKNNVISNSIQTSMTKGNRSHCKSPHKSSPQQSHSCYDSCHFTEQLLPQTHSTLIPNGEFNVCNSSRASSSLTNVHNGVQGSTNQVQPSSNSAHQSQSSIVSNQVQSICPSETSGLEGSSRSVVFSGHSSLKPNDCVSSKSSITIMPTAEVLVFDVSGQAIRCRALLDTGSDSCLISQDLANRLALPSVHQDRVICTVAESKTRSTISHCVLIQSTDQIWNSEEECIVVSKIAPSIPQFELDISTFTVPANIKLADPHFHESRGVDILLGASVFAAIMTCGQISTAPGAPLLQNTALGWVVFGSIKLLTPIPKPRHYHANCIASFDVTNCCVDISNQLEKFWQMEEVVGDARRPAEELKMENHYNETTVRLDDGRFVVKIPRKENIVKLGSSKRQAHDRFLSLEKRLSRNTDLKMQYVTFMREYELLGHMSVAPPLLDTELAYYIPHHPVFKPDSTTTKLRVVFDASAKTTSGISLNDTLYTGHKVQPDLFDIVLRFRMHKVAFIADIAKMYRQVLLDPSDRNLHRIFWRENDSLPLKQYCLNTITYGTGPAAFLATRTLIKLAELETSPESPVFQSICNDFYIDDCISGAPTVDQAISLAHDLTSLLSHGGFELRKFMASSPELIASIPTHLVETSTVKPVSEAEDGITKALGLLWNANLDALSISSNLSSNSQSSSTKRQLLSVVASIYDPLGLVSPLVVLPKILIQKLWLLKLGWDDKLPPELIVQWLEIVQHLPNIEKISIPRCVLSFHSDSVFEIHGFSDASSTAYGACIYLRSSSDDSIQSHLLCSKSRVAPLKVVSIPRLELSAALLLSRLVVRVLDGFKQLNITISNVYLWSDSTIVCSWLKALPDKKDVFVSGRVAEIQESTARCTWNHVKTINNPADIVSRGATPSSLIQNQLWWHGPAWLVKPSTHWDSFSSHVAVLRPSNVVLVNNVSESIFSPLLTYFSKHTKLVRSAAYVLRFIYNVRHPHARRSSEVLSVEELNNAEVLVIRSVQEECFSSELKQLRDSREVLPSSTLKALTPFIHDDNLIRVGGRLQNANIEYDYKHQIILPSKHNFTKALIISTHQRLFHAGVAATMAALRQRYWVPSTRRTVKAVLRRCLKCFRFTQFKAEQQMGQLPAVRVNVGTPFLNAGVDYMGPISLRVGGPKSRTFNKAYIALFICMTTRAVHLEVVSELSTKAFIAALSRFASVRGIPTAIYSDNGTAFVGADNELQELRQFLASSQTQRSLQTSAAAWHIQWNFIPPRAPNFGGLWERSIKSFKEIFKVVTLKQILNFEELSTLSAQIGAILNSRPLVPLSEDPHDLAYLSPGHFLIGRPLNALPSKQVKTNHINHLARWQRIAEMTQQLWNRWSNEYLVSLQKKDKWTSQSPNIVVGTLVLLKDPGTSPTLWRLGRITQVIRGTDNLVRVVMVMTEAGVFKRAISSIAPLPLDEADEEPLV